MNDDQVFRLVLILGLVTVCPVGIYHRLKSQASGERLDRRQEGIFILVTLRPIGVAGMLGLLAYVINPAWMSWSQVGLPTWLRWSGVGIGVSAALLLIWVFRRSRHESHRHRCNEGRAHTGHHGPLSVGPPSVLLGNCTGRNCQLPGHGKLVLGPDRWIDVRPARRSHADGRREADRTFRRRVSSVYGSHREVPAAAASTGQAAFDGQLGRIRVDGQLG